MILSREVAGFKSFRVAALTGVIALLMIITPAQIKPVQAGFLGGAMGGALFGGLIGGRRGALFGAITGGMIGAASKAARKASITSGRSSAPSRPAAAGYSPHGGRR